MNVHKVIQMIGKYFSNRNHVEKKNIFFLMCVDLFSKSFFLDEHYYNISRLLPYTSTTEL